MNEKNSVCFTFNNFHTNAPFTGTITIDEDKVKNIDIDFFHTEIYKEGMWNNSSCEQILNNFQKLSSFHSITNTEAFCRVIENMKNIEVTLTTKRLRIVFNEIERINSHLLVLGNMTDIMGMDILRGEIMRQKDKISKLFYELCGSRIFTDFNTIGDTIKINRQTILKINIIIKSIDDYFKGISKLFHEDSSIKKTLKGVGVLKSHEARILGVTGPIAKASGIDKDLRRELYELINIKFRTVIYESGDCYARALIRVDEIVQSINLIYEMLESTTLENITLENATLDNEKSDKILFEETNTLHNNNDEMSLRYEQSEGASEIYVELGQNGIVIKIILNTFRENAIKAMKLALINANFIDVPIIMASFNYCDCGMEVK